MHKLQRSISNLVPAPQRHLPGDDVHLPYLGQLAMFSLEQDEELLIDSEDLTSCYNLFSLPPQWAAFTAVGSSVFGLAPGEPMYPAWCHWPRQLSGTWHLVFNLSGVPRTTEVRKTAGDMVSRWTPEGGSGLQSCAGGTYVRTPPGLSKDLSPTGPAAEHRKEVAATEGALQAERLRVWKASSSWQLISKFSWWGCLLPSLPPKRSRSLSYGIQRTPHNGKRLKATPSKQQYLRLGTQPASNCRRPCGHCVAVLTLKQCYLYLETQLAWGSQTTCFQLCWHCKNLNCQN